MKPSTIEELINGAKSQPPYACALLAQLEELRERTGSNGKPFLDIVLRDQSGHLPMKLWSDSVAFEICRGMETGDFVEVEGTFSWKDPYGLDPRNLQMRRASEADIDSLFGDDDPARAALRQELDSYVASIRDPRLRALAGAFLNDFGDRFRRAAAARVNHHAYRGGLLAHTVSMLRSGDALTGAYPELNRDLLMAGILFHDIGKIFETCPGVRSFSVERDLHGELLGHIPLGLEIVNSLWRKLPLEEWKAIEPDSHLVRLHLLHLIASHHGELEFGAPVKPKTPEAVALHFIDNLDARLEMLKDTYRLGEVAPNIYDRSRPLGVSPVEPLSVSPSPGTDPPP